MMVYSTNADVTPPDIEFKIEVGDGWQKFSPDENGVIAFTSRPDWADSILISNQPKGTLQLDIGFLASPLSGTSISYQELMGLVPQFEEALTGLSKMQGQPPPKIKGLTIQMPEGSSASRDHEVRQCVVGGESTRRIRRNADCRHSPPVV
jgi:hypothetical protein